MGAGRLSAGAATSVITPPVGVDLTGYGGRPSGCTSVHDDLYARALVLANDDVRLALVSLDVIGVDFDVLDRIRQGVTSQTGIAAEHIVLNASHTHAGPATQSLRGLGEPDTGYVERFVAAIVRTVSTAVAAAVPARVGYGRVPVQIGLNRRYRGSDGRIVIADNPHGVVAPYADILRVADEDGNTIAVWFTHACHPTTLGGDNLAVSAEFPGVAVDTVEAVEDGVAMFAQGCCGDINPIRRGSFDAVERNGRILGAAVVSGLQSITADDATPSLGACLEVVPLSLQTPTPVHEIEALVASFRTQVENAKSEGRHRGHVWLRQAWLDWALSMRARSSGQEPAQDTCPFEVQVARIGDLAQVGLPGEVFAEIGLSISDHSPFALTSVLGYTNGCHGYVPTGSAYALGGYEVSDAIRYYGTQMFAPASDSELRFAALRMLHELRQEIA